MPAAAKKPSSAKKRAARVKGAKAGAAVVRTKVEPDLAFVAKLAPWLGALKGYTRLQTSGLEHIPKTGPAILAANHTGWLGLDYALTVYSVYEATGRIPRGLVHDAWFQNPATAQFARKVGLTQVSKDAMAHALEDGHLVMVFPEGEKGAFRPASDYMVEEFARGFVRVALQTGAPVIPVAVLGGEEANPVGSRIESYQDLLKMGIPLPKNVFPKPVKWRIRFLPPVSFGTLGPGDVKDSAAMHEVAEQVRAKIQAELRTLKTERGHPYL